MEIILEIVAKLSLNKPLPTAVVKVFSRPYHRITERTLAETLNPGVSLEKILHRRSLFPAKFLVDATDETVWQVYRDRCPEGCRAVVEEADRICRHEFNLLGSGLHSWGASIDWHVDPKSAYRWPKKFYTELFPVSRPANGADVKLPWELSRMQHLPTLGQAYRLTGKEYYARELVAQITHWLDDNPCLLGVN